MRELESIIKQIEFIFESLNDGIAIIDHKGIIVYVNDSNERITGKGSEHFIGRHVTEIVPDSAMPDVIKSGEKLIDITTHVMGVTVVSNIVPIVIQGRTIGAISIFRDITEVRKLSEKLEYANNTIKHLYEKLAQVNEDRSDFIVGQSGAMQDVLKLSLKAANVDSNLLIEGESGTGKEVVARFTHRNSARRDKPFIALNCASIPFNLLESELFGYEDGAFTGAKRGGRPGLFEVCKGGTLLLDEIGDMDIMLQSKLLRVIQNKEIIRVGGNKVIPVDVRIMASTHKNLKKLVEERKFREDLYYRLEVIKIVIPPLRERKQDIVHYIEYIASKMAKKMRRNITIGEDAAKILIRYDYPGNIRELENIIERSIVMDEDGIINIKDLPLYIKESYHKGGDGLFIDYESRFPSMDEIEEDILKKALEKYRSKSEVSRILGLSRATLYRKLEKYNLL